MTAMNGPCLGRASWQVNIAKCKRKLGGPYVEQAQVPHLLLGSWHWTEAKPSLRTRAATEPARHRPQRALGAQGTCRAGVQDPHPRVLVI